MQVQAYLFFEGRCEEAIAFYQQVLGAKVEMLMRFSESPDPVPAGMIAPGAENKVMHAALRIGDSLVMASDGGCMQPAQFQGFFLSLSVPSEAEADRIFAALADGGEIRMPIGKTFFSPRFGMVADRFGVPWMVVAQADTPSA